MHTRGRQGERRRLMCAHSRACLQLEARIRAAWAALSQVFIRNTIDAQRGRIQLIIDNGGARNEHVDSKTVEYCLCVLIVFILCVVGDSIVQLPVFISSCCSHALVVSVLCKCFCSLLL
jgi:hypothetical protein